MQDELLPDVGAEELELPYLEGSFGTQFDLSQFQFDTTNSMCDAWFSQQVMDLEYMQGV